MSSFDPLSVEAPVFEVQDFRDPEPFQPLDGSVDPPPTDGGPEPDTPSAPLGTWEEGYAAAREEHARERDDALASALHALGESAKALDADRRETLHAHRDAIVELALAIAEQILREELVARPEHVAGWVNDALTALRAHSDEGSVRVHLCPRDLAVVQSANAADSSGPVDWIEDDDLAPGEVRLERGATTLSAGLEAGLEELRRTLREGRSHGDGTR